MTDSMPNRDTVLDRDGAPDGDSAPDRDSAPYRDGAPNRDGDVVRKLSVPPERVDPVDDADRPPGARLRVADLLASWSDRLAGRPSPTSGATGAGATGGGAGVPGGGRPRWSRRRKGWVAVVGLLVVVVVAALVAGANSTSSYSASLAVAPSAPGYGAADQAAPVPAPDGDFGEAGSAAAADEVAATAERSSVAQPPPTDGAARPPGAEPRIVRNGSASVEVAAGRVEAATRSLTGTVTGLGGYVEASELTGTAATDDDRAQFASLTMRVPSDSFDELLGGLGEVGTVLSSTTSSRDVTGEYVDLEARIRALETSRSTYLTLLTQADTVGDTLAVQQNIDSVQLQLEQIEGQRQVLADATDLATLSVQVAEEGAPTTRPEPEPSGIGAAFEESWDRFVDGLEDVIAAIGPIVLFLLLLLLGYGIVRLCLAIYRRRHSAPSPPPAPPAPPAPSDPSPAPSSTSPAA